MESRSGVEGRREAGRAPGTPSAPDSLKALSALTAAIAAADRGIAQMQASREILLAMAAELAHALIDDGVAPAGFEDARWDSRAAELAERSVAAEIATATRASDRSIQRQMGAAVELVEHFPATLEAFCEGRIGMGQVRVIQDAGAVLDDPAARAGYEAAVLAAAVTQAPGRLRRVAAREAEKAQSEPLTVRHQRARVERRVWLNPLPDGMAELAAVLPAVVAHGVFGRLTQLAKACTEGDRERAGSWPMAGSDTTRTDPASAATDETATPVAGPRTRDQLRADLLADLLLHGTPASRDTPDGLLAGITARVEITVPVLMLIGTDGAGAAGQTGAEDGDSSAVEGRVTSWSDSSAAAELDGRHPIDAETARALAGAASAWNRVLTDPITGAVLAVDRYRPSEELRRLLRARDSRCRFPGCNITASELDLDHTHDAALGGATELANLAGLCRRHHTLKHHTHWTPRQQGDGTLEWTSPTGRKHLDHPPTPATHMVRAAASPPEAGSPGSARGSGTSPAPSKDEFHPAPF